MGVNSLPKTVTRQRRDCDLNPGSFVYSFEISFTFLESRYGWPGFAARTTPCGVVVESGFVKRNTRPTSETLLRHPMLFKAVKSLICLNKHMKINNFRGFIWIWPLKSKHLTSPCCTAFFSSSLFAFKVRMSPLFTRSYITPQEWGPRQTAKMSSMSFLRNRLKTRWYKKNRSRTSS